MVDDDMGTGKTQYVAGNYTVTNINSTKGNISFLNGELLCKSEE